MNRLIRALLLSGAIAGAAHAGTPAPDLPDGIAYAPASEADTVAATSRLRAALAGGPATLAPLLGLDADVTVLVGPYLAIEMNGHGLDGTKVLSTARYHLPVPGGEPLTVDAFRAKARPQKLFLAHYLQFIADFSGPLTIRAPDFDELALTWAWIAWDLEGPLLVVETARDKYLFDFDRASGTVSWVERLSRPCFTAHQEDREALSCTCTGVARDGHQWNLRFSVQQSCPAHGLASVAGSVGAVDATKPAAVIEVDERTAPVDALLARHFGADYAITTQAANQAGFRGPGKLLEGAPPVAPKDEHGEPVHAYVLLGSVIGADGRATDNRVLLSTDERASAAALAAAKDWRVEPATRDGKPVAELVWQQLNL